MYCCEWCKIELQKHSLWNSLGFNSWAMLFIMSINDLPLCSKFKTILYADDTYLSLSLSSLSNLQSMVNNELLKVHDWMSLNKLPINYAKSIYLLTGKKTQSNLAEDFLVRLRSQCVFLVASY